jgi:hypothetical protein
VPLWARFPQAGELMALPLMLALQIAAASVMLPLVKDWTQAAILLLAAWPMNVALWIVSVAATSISCRSPRARGLACALMTMWSIGGGLLLYVRLEFLPAIAPLPGLIVGPLVATLRELAIVGHSRIWPPLPPLAILLVILSLFRRQPPTHAQC